MPKKLLYEQHSKVDIYRKSISTKELMEMRRSLAKRANQRLVRLERSSSIVSGKSYIDIGVGQIVKQDLASKGRTRWSETLSGTGRGERALNRRQLQREIIELQSFLEAKTSTVAGAKDVEGRRLQSFEEKGLGTVAREESFYKFLNSENYKQLVKSLDSDQIVDFYNKQYKEGIPAEEIEKQFDDYLEGVTGSASGEISYKGMKQFLTSARRTYNKAKRGL